MPPLQIDTSMEDLGSSDQKLGSPENMNALIVDQIVVEEVAPDSVVGSDSAIFMSEMENPAMSPDRADANTAIVIEMDPQYQDRADTNTAIAIEMDPQYQVRCHKQE
ncbi:hypothetical protein ZHAS_00011934 [Anopheles sinensis]|uniref:Uncharacterized protein n=1 Tax=Anopheles sinensis TaxID=74873 RepID=A0A084W1K4_ANOSI|nr:hypothetical protein ZHAS_00011934 [Anopheles sinensis]